MVEDKKVIVIERPGGDYAIAITNGSDDFRDAELIVSASYKKDAESLQDMLESALFFAARRVASLEKGGYSPPPDGVGSAGSGCGI